MNVTSVGWPPPGDALQSPGHPIPVRAEIRCGLRIGLALAAAGVLLGVLWAALVPHVAVFAVDASRRYLLPNLTEDRASAAGDVLMLGLLAAAGLLAGLLVARTARREVVGAVCGLVLGGSIAGLIAMAVGHLLVQGDYTPLRTAAQGAVVQVRPFVKGSADWVMLPLVGSLVLLIAGTPALLRGDPDPELAELAEDATAPPRRRFGPLVGRLR
jgi:hypothetical protein